MTKSSIKNAKIGWIGLWGRERGGVCMLKIKVQLDSKTPEKVCVTNLGSRECSVQLNITITL